MNLSVNLTNHQSHIILERGILHHLLDYLDLNCKVLIITDENVAPLYSQLILDQCPQGYLYVTCAGEQAKSFSVYESILKKLLDLNFSRKDLILALGGGVIGDLSGFVAATYKRGMRFASIPTSTLSQIDSSIGGKVAINIEGFKNMAGTFYHPEKVLIDPDTLQTLPKRHYYNGLAEAVKTGLIGDESLFALFEKENISDHIEEIIYKSLSFKKKIVEMDEKEENIRKILNFGHTIGHAIETYYELHDYYHGECVSMGMMAILEEGSLKNRLRFVLEKLHLPTSTQMNADALYQIILKDKKSQQDHITLVKVYQCGHAVLEETPLEEVYSYLKGEQNEKCIR